MAETFQRVEYDVTTSYANAYVCPAATTAIVIGFWVANMHASTDSWVSIRTVITGDATNAILSHEINVPINDTFMPLDGNKLVLEADEEIEIQAENTASLEATISILEIT